MAHSNREQNKAERDAEKAKRKAANLEKVNGPKVILSNQKSDPKSDKPKTVWEKLADERRGTVTTTDEAGKTVTRKKSRVLSAKARQSHHRGHGEQRATICLTYDGGKTVRKVKREKAHADVKAGKASYKTRADFRKFVAKQEAATQPIAAKKK